MHESKDISPAEQAMLDAKEGNLSQRRRNRKEKRMIEHGKGVVKQKIRASKSPKPRRDMAKASRKRNRR